MAAKKDIQVLIGGKVYTLSGYESEEYLQKVSAYLNHKLTECSNNESYRKQSAETRSILLALNIADDYFKAKTQADSLENDAEGRDKEVYDLKHDLISTQIKYENTVTLIIAVAHCQGHRIYTDLTFILQPVYRPFLI